MYCIFGVSGGKLVSYFSQRVIPMVIRIEIHGIKIQLTPRVIDVSTARVQNLKYTYFCTNLKSTIVTCH